MCADQVPLSSSDSASVPRRDWAALVFPCALLALCLALYLWRLGATPLEDFDEAYYAEGAREMLARKDLGTPYFNGQPFLLKPILIYWMIAAAFRVLGPTEFAARVGSAFLGTLVVLVTYWFCAHTITRRAGFFAGLSLALSYMWIDIARDASIDVPLTSALTPALFLFFLASSAPSHRRRWLYLSCYPLLGLAVLAKGPVPTAVVMVGLLLFVATAGLLRETLREAQLLPGIALFLAVAGPWYWYELSRQPAFFSTFFIGEHFGHIGGELARTEPVWGNLKYTLIYFYPWAAFLPPALAHAFRQHDRAHVLRFASWWTIAVLLLFSIPRSKLAHYLAPAFPAMAILVGAWLDAWLNHQAVSRLWTGVAFGIIGLTGAVCVTGAVLAAWQPEFVREMIARKYGDWTPGTAPAVILVAIAIGSLLSLLAARWNRSVLAPALAGAMLVAALAHVGWFKLRLAQIQAQPRKELAQFASAALAPSQPLGVYYAKRNATVFYFARPIVDLGERPEEFARLVSFLSSDRPAALLTHRKFLPDLEQLDGSVFLLHQRADYVLVANQPPAGQGRNRGGGS